MKRFILTLCLALAALPAFSAELSLDKRIIEHTAPNGIKLLILERHFSPTVSIRMIFRTGSVDEVEGKTGLAHMFEHMMFKGTRTMGTKDYAKEAPLLAQVDKLHQNLDAEKAKGAKADQAKIAHIIDQLHDAEQKAGEWVVPNELWNLYEREGASDLNAGTAADLTQYVVDLPSNKIKLWALLDSDRLKNPVFRQFYQEREVVKEERRMRVDSNPDGKMYEQFLSVAYSSHPYHHPTIGWETDLDHLTVEDLTAFYNQHYTPDRLTIVIVGDVNPKEVISLVDRDFGTWKPALAPEPKAIVPEPQQRAQRRTTVESEAEPRVMIGFHTPVYPDPDYFVFSALARLLGDGQSSRLYKNLVEKKHLAVTADVDPSAPGERYPTLFVINMLPRFPHTAAEVEKAVFEELDKIKTTPIEPWELQKVRSRVEVDLLNTLQTNDGMASTLAYDQCVLGDWRYIVKYQQAMDALTASDIQKAAQRIFRPENATIAIRVKKVEKREKKKPQQR